ncbi:hypothetical protein PMAYCL1PPCAC_03413, partial [Pristionchus mayeri]
NEHKYYKSTVTSFAQSASIKLLTLKGDFNENNLFRSNHPKEFVAFFEELVPLVNSLEISQCFGYDDLGEVKNQLSSPNINASLEKLAFDYRLTLTSRK